MQERNPSRKLNFWRGRSYISHISLKQQQLMKIVSCFFFFFFNVNLVTTIHKADQYAAKMFFYTLILSFFYF